MKLLDGYVYHTGLFGQKAMQFLTEIARFDYDMHVNVYGGAAPHNLKQIFAIMQNGTVMKPNGELAVDLFNNINYPKKCQYSNEVFLKKIVDYIKKVVAIQANIEYINKLYKAEFEGKDLDEYKFSLNNFNLRFVRTTNVGYADKYPKDKISWEQKIYSPAVECYFPNPNSVEKVYVDKRHLMVSNKARVVNFKNSDDSYTVDTFATTWYEVLGKKNELFDKLWNDDSKILIGTHFNMQQVRCLCLLLTNKESKKLKTFPEEMVRELAGTENDPLTSQVFEVQINDYFEYVKNLQVKFDEDITHAAHVALAEIDRIKQDFLMKAKNLAISTVQKYNTDMGDTAETMKEMGYKVTEVANQINQHYNTAVHCFETGHFWK